MPDTKLQNIYVFAMHELNNEENFHQGALISILNPDKIRTFDTKSYNHILLLDFDSTSFNEENALRVLKFVDKIKSDVLNLTIHCKFGAGRSPGIAYAIREILKEDIVNFHCKSTTPNKYILEIIGKTYAKLENNTTQLL